MESEQKYPSIDLGYDIALRSYDWIINRWEAQQSRIENFINWATIINLALITVLFGNFFSKLMFTDWLFYITVFLFLGVTILSIWVKSSGNLMLIIPKHIYNMYLHLSEYDFKENIVYYSVDHFEKNIKSISRREYISNICQISFLIQVTTELFWTYKSLSH
ncbi:MAG: hypothetical protein KDC42_04355 [Ignavibacteriae bacterium]|nr:hypothetical protein [Ignavibacteriota bacterium]